MIGRLRGTLIEKQPPELLIEVSGVGYEVQMPMSCFYELPNVGEEAIIYTHFVVREDAQLLYGFLSKQDRDMFRVLIKVNGVGPKLGITILSGLDSAALTRCVSNDEVSTLVKLPGIGKKTAERLLIELRDKVKDLCDDKEALLQEAIPYENAIQDEAESALVALGYKPQDAAKAIKQAKHENQSLESLIKAALKSMI